MEFRRVLFRSVSCLIQPLPAMKRRWCGSFPLIGGRFCPIGDECFAVFPSSCYPFCCWHGLSWRSRFCGLRKRRRCSTVSPRHLQRRLAWTHPLLRSSEETREGTECYTKGLSRGSL